jgi:uncharacterized protein (DUF1778 family)
MSRSTGDKATADLHAVIETGEVIKVSDRDFVRILELLEHPPKPNAKLRAAIAALPEAV